MIRGLKFAAVPVSDQDRALAFYTGKLGFRVVTDQPYDAEQRWLELRIPGSDARVVLFCFGEVLRPGGNTNLTFWSDDVKATVQELKDRGVKIVMEPVTEAWGTAAAFEDLDGNRFGLSSK